MRKDTGKVRAKVKVRVSTRVRVKVKVKVKVMARARVEDKILGSLEGICVRYGKSSEVKMVLQGGMPLNEEMAAFKGFE